MRNPERDAIAEAKRREAYLTNGFEMFSAKSIDAVPLPEVAKASGYGIATLYRYYKNKGEFALAIAELKWGEFFAENRKRSPIHDLENSTAADMLE